MYHNNRRSGLSNETEAALKWLQRYQELKSIALNKREKANQARERASSVQFDMTAERVQTTPQNRIEMLITKAVDLDEKAKACEEQAETVKTEIEMKLYDLEDSKECDVLMLHYIDNMTFAAIGEKIDRVERQVYRIHNNAVDHLIKLLK